MGSLRSSVLMPALEQHCSWRLLTSQVPQQWSPLLRMTFSSRHSKKPGFDRSGCDTAADKRVIVRPNCWGCVLGLGSARHRAGLVLSLSIMQPGWLGITGLSILLCNISPLVLACPYCSVQVCVLLFSSDSILIILNIRSAVRNFPESYLNVNKSLMVYVKEGKR